MRLPSTVDTAGDDETRPRRRLLVISPRAHLKQLRDVFTALMDSGTELVFAGKGLTNIQRAVDRLGHPLATAVALPLRRTDAEAEAIRRFRSLCNLTFFFHPDLRKAAWSRKRASFRFLKASGYAVARGPDESLAAVELPAEGYAGLTEMVEHLERSISPEPALVDAIAALGVDGVLLVSRFTIDGAEPDVIKVARQLGLPSITLVFSWDSLSSRAVLHEHPDHVIVWNESQAWEAVNFHGIPADRILVRGAANFDRFFGELEQISRPATDQDARTILYLGSSKASLDEPALFAEWLRAVRAAEDVLVRDANVVLRPHPGTLSGGWQDWTPPADPLLAVELPERNVTLTLAQSLSRADVVVALSTSAELEAAIAGCPVVTFRAGAAAPAQEGTWHFHLLLESNGGFVIDARDLPEHVARLSAVLQGEHDAEAQQRFVEQFVRPAGLDRPVVPIVADTIVELVESDERAGRQAGSR